MAALENVNNFLASSKYRSYLALIKGFRNGVVYGAKVRFPHALVMTFLFKGGPLSGQLSSIAKATYTHSGNLAKFVLAYKTLKLVLLELSSGKPQEGHSFVAAFIGGYLIWGQNNKINEQINLYLLSRILYGLVKLGARKGIIPTPKQDPFPLFAAVVWGVVLWLFEHHRSCLQGSLQSSMTYLYHDSERWNGLWNFLIHNK